MTRLAGQEAPGRCLQPSNTGRANAFSHALLSSPEFWDPIRFLYNRHFTLSSPQLIFSSCCELSIGDTAGREADRLWLPGCSRYETWTFYHCHLHYFGWMEPNLHCLRVSAAECAPYWCLLLLHTHKSSTPRPPSCRVPPEHLGMGLHTALHTV